jgi:hypothetical protein
MTGGWPHGVHPAFCTELLGWPRAPGVDQHSQGSMWPNRRLLETSFCPHPVLDWFHAVGFPACRNYLPLSPRTHSKVVRKRESGSILSGPIADLSCTQLAVSVWEPGRWGQTLRQDLWSKRKGWLLTSLLLHKNKSKRYSKSQEGDVEAKWKPRNCVGKKVSGESETNVSGKSLVCDCHQLHPSWARHIAAQTLFLEL